MFPFNLINPLLNNPLLQDAGVGEALHSAAANMGLRASRSEEALDKNLVNLAKKNKTSPWQEAIKQRRAAGQSEGGWIGGDDDLKNLEHKYYAKEFSSFSERDAASNWIGSFAHAGMKALGLRGKDNRQTSVREITAGLEGTAAGAADLLRKRLGLDNMK